MVNIVIDGKELQASEGAMLIEAADDAGIYIPRFCYHKKLSIAANCRMCLVEVEKVGKALPACATPVTEGMKIFTRSSKAIDAQKSVMEFLLINHPLDCPICDQGGECELQDIAMGFGGDVSTYAEKKRVVPNKDFGPLITGDMTRCIHCTRCIRFGEEIAGIKELGATGRGEHMEIGTYVSLSINSEMSGNIIDLCPVGALTAKPSRFTARAWEMTQLESIAPHDCIGSNILLHVFRNKVSRAVPRENEKINETWLSDRDRFSYEGLNSDERLTTPMVKVDGSWEETSWDVALNKALGGLTKILSDKGTDQVGALISPSATLEEHYLLQKLMSGMGSGNVDHRLSQVDFSHQSDAPVFPWLGQSIEDLENNDAVLLVGSNVRRDQPIAGHRIRKAAMKGASIMCVNAFDYDYNFPVYAKCITSAAELLTSLSAILKALAVSTSAELPTGLDALLKDVQVDGTHEKIAQQLLSAERSSIILGHEAIRHTQFESLRSIAGQIAKLSSSQHGILSDGANSAGAWLAGAVPHRGIAGQSATISGKNVGEMLTANLSAYLLLGVEPEYDCANSVEALNAMKQADFVVSLNSFCNDATKSYADVILPISTFSETSGTYVNAEGCWQSFEGVVEPLGDARPAWKVLRVLGNLFECEDFEYINSHEIRDEVKSLVANIDANNETNWNCPTSLLASTSNQGEINHSMYSGDCLQRRAVSLQRVDQAQLDAMRSKQETIENVGAVDNIKPAETEELEAH